MSGLAFESSLNYMKRDSSTGSNTMLGPSTSYYYGVFYGNDYVVTHNLGLITGFVPMFRVYYEPFGDGKIIKAQNNSNYVMENPPLTTAYPFVGGPTCLAKMNSTTLTISLYYQDNTLASNIYPIYWVIYKDYGL